MAKITIPPSLILRIFFFTIILSIVTLLFLAPLTSSALFLLSLVLTYLLSKVYFSTVGLRNGNTILVTGVTGFSTLIGQTGIEEVIERVDVGLISEVMVIFSIKSNMSMQSFILLKSNFDDEKHWLLRRTLMFYKNHT